MRNVLSALLGLWVLSEAPQAYAQTVATPINQSGAPSVQTYKAASGVYHKASPVSLVCSTDASGNPVPCNYLSAGGGTITGPVSGGYYMPQCYTIAALKALPKPTGAAYACYYDPNNSNQPNIAVYALGVWRYVALGNGSL